MIYPPFHYLPYLQAWLHMQLSYLALIITMRLDGLTTGNGSTAVRLLYRRVTLMTTLNARAGWRPPWWLLGSAQLLASSVHSISTLIPPGGGKAMISSRACLVSPYQRCFQAILSSVDWPVSTLVRLSYGLNIEWYRFMTSGMVQRLSEMDWWLGGMVPRLSEVDWWLGGMVKDWVI